MMNHMGETSTKNLMKKLYKESSVKQVKDTINNFSKWVKGTELVELTDIDVKISKTMN